MAAHATAAIARDHRDNGRTAQYLTQSQHAAQLYEDARISRGDTEALLDRTERVLELQYLYERDRNRALDEARNELEAEALEAASAALMERRRK